MCCYASVSTRRVERKSLRRAGGKTILRRSHCDRIWRDQCMADTNVYRQWRAMTSKAPQWAVDESLPLWQRVDRVRGAYNGIELSGLRSRHRNKMMGVLQEINLTLQRYELETFEDYQEMAEQDLCDIIKLAQGMSHTSI